MAPNKKQKRKVEDSINIPQNITTKKRSKLVVKKKTVGKAVKENTRNCLNGENVVLTDVLPNETRIENDAVDGDAATTSSNNQKKKTKRPLNGFQLFYQDATKHSHKVRKVSDSTSVPMTSKEAAQKWNSLTEAEKKPWIDQENVKLDEFHENSRPSKTLMDNRMYCRCSPSSFFNKVVVKVLKDEGKKKAVIDMGFGGLLGVMPFNLNKVVITALLRSFNSSDMELRVHGVVLKITQENVSQILGLPASGLDILTTSMEKDEDHAVRSLYGLPKTDISLSSLDKLLASEWETPGASDNFKCFFILYAVATIINPNTSLNVVSFALRIVKDLEMVRKLNWAKLVLDGLVEAKTKFAEGKGKKYIIGCMMFLKIFYFDSIYALVKAEDEHVVGARVQVWNRNKVKNCCKRFAVQETLARKQQTVPNSSSIPVTNTSYEAILAKLHQVDGKIDTLKSEFGAVKDELVSLRNFIVGIFEMKRDDERERRCNAEPYVSPSTNKVKESQVFEDCSKEDNDTEINTDVDVSESALEEAVWNYLTDTELNPRESIVDVGKTFAERSAFTLFKDNGWLNSEIINLVVAIMSSNENNNTIWFLPTYFSAKILTPKVKEAQVMTFLLERGHMTSLVGCEKIIFPMNDNSMHWYLCCINLTRMKIEIVDTLRGSAKTKSRHADVTKVIKYCERIFKDSRFERNLAKFPRLDTLPLVDVQVVEQTNGNDCGAYLAQYLRNATIDYMDVVIDPLSVRGELMRFIVFHHLNKHRYAIARMITKLKLGILNINVVRKAWKDQSPKIQMRKALPRTTKGKAQGNGDTTVVYELGSSTTTSYAPSYEADVIDPKLEPEIERVVLKMIQLWG